MIGITLSSELISRAPVEVQRWIEQQVVASIHPEVPANGASHGAHLVSCSEQGIAAILSQIQNILPAVSVLFELGRKTTTFGRPDIPAFRLVDIAHHTRLQNAAQVAACLEIINQAFVRISGDPDARLCGLDRDGTCFVAAETQQNIQNVWQNVVAAPQGMFDQGDVSPLPGVPAPPPAGPGSAAAPTESVAGREGNGAAAS